MSKFRLKNISLSGIASCLPDNKVDIQDFQDVFTSSEIKEHITRSGIKNIYISGEEQTASDLGFIAAEEILKKTNIEKDDIGLIIFISSTPDYRSPATATVLQHRLDIPRDCLVYDINQGAGGFISGINIGGALLSNMEKAYGLIVIGDTPSKQFKSNDLSSLYFSDSGSALLLKKESSNSSISIQTKVYSEELETYMHRLGGFRISDGQQKKALWPGIDVVDNLYINFSDLGSFVVDKAISTIQNFITDNELSADSIDYLLLGYPGINEYNTITKALSFSGEKVPNYISNYGILNGSFIPVYLSHVCSESNNSSLRIIASSYGEGMHYSLVDMKINKEIVLPTVFSNSFFEDGKVSHEI